MVLLNETLAQDQLLQCPAYLANWETLELKIAAAAVGQLLEAEFFATSASLYDEFEVQIEHKAFLGDLIWTWLWFVVWVLLHQKD